MLTKEEARLVVKRMREYPRGVNSNAWGFGPMEHEDDPFHPTDYTLSDRKEYG